MASNIAAFTIAATRDVVTGFVPAASTASPITPFHSTTTFWAAAIRTDATSVSTNSVAVLRITTSIALLTRVSHTFRRKKSPTSVGFSWGFDGIHEDTRFRSDRRGRPQPRNRAGANAAAANRGEPLQEPNPRRRLG